MKYHGQQQMEKVLEVISLGIYCNCIILKPQFCYCDCIILKPHCSVQFCIMYTKSYNLTTCILKAMSHAVYIHDITHVIVDNLQFMLGMDFTEKNRFVKQDHVVSAFRQFATEKNCHVTLIIHPRKVEKFLSSLKDRLRINIIETTSGYSFACFRN